MTSLGQRVEQFYTVINSAETGDYLTVNCNRKMHHGIYRRRTDLEWEVIDGRKPKFGSSLASWELELLLSVCDDACLS